MSTASAPHRDLVLGIDCSTTASKAVAWDRVGRAVAEGRAPLSTRSPEPGWGEQDARTWWEATVTAVRELGGRVSLDRIAALCVTHQRETFVPLDAAGEPLRAAILWLDERSRDQLATLDRLVGHDRLHRLTGRPPSLTQSLPKLLWLVEREPEIAASAAAIVDTGAYLVWHLTGERRTGTASADPMGIIDMAAGSWATDVIAAIGLDPVQFWPLTPPGEEIGQVSLEAARQTGLRPGTPVIAGAGDGQAASLGAGIVSPHRAYVNLGTAIAGGTSSPTYVTDDTCRTCLGALPGSFVLESVLRGGTATVAWFMDHVADPSRGPAAFDAYEREAAALPPGAGGLVLVPYWNTVMNPYWDPTASGIVVGWNGSHRRYHLYRALLEGIALEHRLAIEGIAATTGTPITDHVVLGGGSRSDLWCQILADVLAAPVHRARSADATNLGAAILAARGAGWFPTVEDAAAAMTGTAGTFRPEPRAAAAYGRLYGEVYRHLFPALRPHLNRLNALTAEIAAGA